MDIARVAWSYARWELRGNLGRFPGVYMPIERLKRSMNPAFRNFAVTASTDLVVEGYPRCASTFVASAIAYMNRDRLSIAHRCHAVAQLRRGLALGIPGVLLLREPRAAVLSSYIYEAGRLSIPFLLRHYRLFYDSAMTIADRLVVSDFETSTRHPERIVQEINGRFGAGLSCHSLDEEQAREIYARIDTVDAAARRGMFNLPSGADANRAATVSRPVRERGALEPEASRRFDRDAPAGLLDQCTKLYDAARSHAIR